MFRYLNNMNTLIRNFLEPDLCCKAVILLNGHLGDLKRFNSHQQMKTFNIQNKKRKKKINISLINVTYKVKKGKKI